MTAAAAALDAVFRIEWPKLVAGLARVVHDVGLAEELAQEAIVVALETWPAAGIPERPGAWLMTTARHRAIDRVRRQRMIERNHEGLAAADPPDVRDAIAASLDEPSFGDDLLRLVFVACHPVLATDARVALTLRLLGGLTTAEIARAFLVPESTIAQRIVRAKRALADAGVAFEVPRAGELAPRLGAVLEVVYSIFTEGYAATSGDAWTRPELCDDALRLGRVIAELAPAQAEVHGLVALMELQASRLRARVGPAGEAILLRDQDRARWDHVLVHRGLAALARAEALPHDPAGGPRGAYVLQASIAACHVAPPPTDWIRIAALYEALAQVAWSPVVELNRAVAVAMVFGPEAGLAIVDAIAAEPALASYHLLPSVRGDLLARLGRRADARADFARAAALATNARERALLRARAEEQT